MKKNILKILIVGFVLISIFSCKKDDPKDTVAPQITILGANPYTVGQGTTYTDPGATASDDQDGDLSSLIVVTSNVNTANTGTYQVKYNVSDKAENAANEVVRTVTVVITK